MTSVISFEGAVKETVFKPDFRDTLFFFPFFCSVFTRTEQPTQPFFGIFCRKQTCRVFSTPSEVFRDLIAIFCSGITIVASNIVGVFPMGTVISRLITQDFASVFPKRTIFLVSTHFFVFTVCVSDFSFSVRRCSSEISETRSEAIAKIREGVGGVSGDTVTFVFIVARSAIFGDARVIPFWGIAVLPLIVFILVWVRLSKLFIRVSAVTDIFASGDFEISPISF